jgi:hypothetical protein
MAVVKVLGRVVWLLALPGCSSLGSGNASSGAVYQSTAENISISGKVISRGTGTGVACSTSYLGLVSVGDASVAAAMASAGIKEPVIVDKTIQNILGLWRRTCTVVRGN